ncbi:hypothetical protein G4G28_14375 [Massilia sp. Dwa41.01b]|uniref:hypothetical protein n=1 Tax=unclassified Massilia TaxID=2609279 RepID=UPI0016013CCA|nr:MULTISPECIES: hypothetical protein [unclassified Massilia]QNA89365.1 hypothetical protein G4G28_14375 [Massilia sp. Dwa41.01b]QNB00260.1 hypothetical protein G4G31_17945 [Massilia sp. Se16.2.3]
MTPANRCGLLLAGCLVLAGCLSIPRAQAAANLKWDLTYKEALRRHRLRDNEMLRYLLTRYPKRAIQERLASYSGEPIEASLLLEAPESKHPMATWYIRTRSAARVCVVTNDREDDCQPLDPARTEAFIREVMHFAPLDPVPDGEHAVGVDKATGTPILMNYYQLLSVSIDGRTLQRPVATLETGMTGMVARDKRHPHAGRMLDALNRLFQLDEASRARKPEPATERGQ